MFTSIYNISSFFINVFFIILASIVTVAAVVVTVVVVIRILVTIFGDFGDLTEATGTPQESAAPGANGSIASSTDDAQTTLQAVAIETVVHQATDAVTHSTQGTLF